MRKGLQQLKDEVKDLELESRQVSQTCPVQETNRTYSSEQLLFTPDQAKTKQSSLGVFVSHVLSVMLFCIFRSQFVFADCPA